MHNDKAVIHEPIHNLVNNLYTTILEKAVIHKLHTLGGYVRAHHHQFLLVYLINSGGTVVYIVKELIYVSECHTKLLGNLGRLTGCLGTVQS